MNVGAGSADKASLKLDCPFCAAAIEIVLAQLIEGQSVQCPHCREEATLAKERIEHGGQDEWKLIEVEYDDERR